MLLPGIIQVDPHNTFGDFGINLFIALLAWDKDKWNIDFDLLGGVTIIIPLCKESRLWAKDESKRQEDKYEQTFSHKFAPFVRMNWFPWLANEPLVRKLSTMQEQVNVD